MNQGYRKYRPFQPIALADRTWPGRTLTQAPVWCSVDLRDGNQALVTPMNLEQKVAFFRMLTAIGFREIEVGFPASSETEFEILRTLIEGDLIPEGVTIQVLVQAREHLIRRTSAGRGTSSFTFTTPPPPSSGRWSLRRTCRASSTSPWRAPALSAP